MPIDIDSLKDSSNRILATASDKLQAEFVPITGELEGEIKNLINNIQFHSDVLDDMNFMVADFLGRDTTNYRVLISVEEDSPLTIWCQRKTPHALYGCSNEFISIDYAPVCYRLSIQIHECLHFFGVKDCYFKKTKKPKKACTNENCLMRYDAPSKEVCGSVICQLKTFAENHSA